MNAQAIAVADIDGNALQDIVVCFSAASSAFQPKISVVLQRALGQLEVVDTSLASLSGLDSFVIADIIGDGRMDVATTGSHPVVNVGAVMLRTVRRVRLTTGRYLLAPRPNWLIGSRHLPSLPSRMRQNRLR